MGDLGARSFRIGVLLTLLVGCFLAAAPAMEGKVLSYDDEALLQGSEDGPGALHRSFGSFLDSTFYYAYLPVYGLSYWVDGKLGATVEHPTLFHVQNVLWHAAACYAVFLLLGLLFANRWAAFLGALLFAVHPLHVESVAWIASRKDVLSGFLLLAAWLMAIRAETRRILLLPALLLFLLACLAKASAVVLPGLLLAAVLLLPRYRGRRAEEARWTLPFWLVGFAVGLLHLMVGREAGVVSGARPYGERFLGFIAAWGGAVERTLLPLGLSIDYPEANATRLSEVLWPGFLLLAALLLFLLLLRRRAAVAAFGVAAFFLALLPFNNVFPSTTVLAADRYLYLSVLGASVLLAWTAARWRWGGAGGTALVVLCLALSISSARRFRSDDELWSRTIEARDDSALAYVNRGLFRTKNGVAASPEGLLDLEAGYARARIDEFRAKAAAGMVLPLLQSGRVDEALERSDDAIAHATGESPAARRFRATVLYNRGLVHGRGARAQSAAARDFVKSADLWPRYQSWYEAGRAFLRAGLADDARKALEEAAALDRTRPEPHLYLAVLWKHADDRERWRRALEEAERRAPQDPAVAGAWVDYWLDERSPNYAKAEEQLARVSDAATRRELSAAVDEQRALYRFRRGDLAEATKAADRAREEGLADASDLGQVYVEAGRYDDAVLCYRTATTGGDAVDAIARALALKAAAKLRDADEEGAEAAMREALAQGPARIEAGAAPLEGEIAELRETGNKRLLLLAAAAVAGDREDTARLCGDLLRSDPSGADRRLFYRLRALVRAYVAADLAGAEDDLRLLVGEDGKDRWAGVRLAQVLTRRGLADLQGDEARHQQGEARIDEAIGILSETIADAPDFVPARLARGEARLARGDLTGAKADYLALRERGVAMKEVCLKEAVLHRLVFVQGGDPANLEAATNLLQRALEEDPNDFEALFELGNVQHNIYDRQDEQPVKRKAAFNRAVLWYRRAMATNPRVPGPRVEWARLILKAAREAIASQQMKTAHDLLMRVEAEAPDVIDVHKERVRLVLMPEFAQDTGMGPDEIFERAGRALAAMERIDPEDADLPGLKALYHRRRGWSFYLTWAKLEGPRKDRARELAVEEFKSAVAAKPDDPDNARIRDLLREIAPQVIVLDEAAARKAYETGLKAFDAGKYAEAADAFHSAVLLFPESIELHWALAKALKMARRDDEACDEFQIVANHAEADRYPEALYELGFFHLARGERLVGRPWLERYIATMTRLGRSDEPLVKIARDRLAQLAGE